MGIIFVGCVKIGLACLKQLIKDRHNILAIFTLAKKYAAKTSGFVDFSPIAVRQSIPIFKIKDINEEQNIKRIRKLNPDLIIVCGWQRLVSNEILKIPRLGVIGFHSSLLPKYRGRAPVNWAIINGEKKTGVTMFFCAPEADTGDIIAQKSFRINLFDTCASVYDKSAKSACQLLHSYLPLIEKGRVKTRRNLSCRFACWPKRNPEDGLINWGRGSIDIHNWIRALTRPYPGAFTYYKGKKCFVWKSKISRFKKAFGAKPGSVVYTAAERNRLNILVATADKPLWISDLTLESGTPIVSVKKDENFTN
jgi:methionyl-tRNA formyltransferase